MAVIDGGRIVAHQVDGVRTAGHMLTPQFYELPSGLRVEVARDGDQLTVAVGEQAPIGFAAQSATKLGATAADAAVSLRDDGDLLVRQSSAEHHCRPL